MGSRAMVIVCRDEGAGRNASVSWAKLWGLSTPVPAGLSLTIRNWSEASWPGFMRPLRRPACGRNSRTDWLCLDCELMPWSAKAQELLRRQYAPTGAAACAALPQAVEVLTAAVATNPELSPLLDEYRERLGLAQRYVDSYRRYCWPVHSLDDLKLAPFHLLASEGQVHVDKDHMWHMQTLGVCARRIRGCCWRRLIWLSIFRRKRP